MTNEQRERLTELVAKQKASAREREILRVKAQMADEIPNFSDKYVFAEGGQAEKLSAFVAGLPFIRPAWIDVERFERRRFYSSPEEFERYADNRRVWICFLSGSAELLDIYAGCTASDYFADFDDWQFFSPFTVLVYNDFGGFIFIDDNGNITEVID